MLLHSDKFANGLGIDIHVRTEIREFYSFINSAAIRIGDDVLEVSSKGVYHLNKVVNAPMPLKVGGFDVKHKGKVGEDMQHRFLIQMQEHGTIEVKVYEDFVAVYVIDADGNDYSDSVGIMGSFESGAMLGRDGETDMSKSPNNFGREWQVRPDMGEKMLFTEIKGPQYPQQCAMPDPAAILAYRESKNKRLRKGAGAGGVSLEEAKAACADWGDNIDACIYDVMATGILELAEGEAM